MKYIQKIFNLLNKKEKKKIGVLLLLILLSVIFDVIGMASIMPFMAVLSNPEIIQENLYLSQLYEQLEKFGVSSNYQFFFIIGLFVLMLLIFSQIIRALSHFYQIRFIYLQEFSLSIKILKVYLYQPYTWFLSRNSSELGKNILSEVGNAISFILMPAISLLAQTLIVFGIFLFLLVIDPIISLVITSVLGLLYSIIFFFLKNYLNKLGVETLKANENRFTSISEAFTATKEIKLNNLENIYIERFLKPASIYANNRSYSQAISTLPRYLLEVIAFGGLIILVLSLIVVGSDFQDTIPIISLYAFAGYRIMPALNQIYFSISQLRFSVSLLNKLIVDLNRLYLSKNKEGKSNNITINKSINLNKVYYSYPESKRTTLRDINVLIPVKKKIGIVGKTGSGKTTIVDLILGLLNPDKGNVTIDDKVITEENKIQLQNIISYVPQQIFLSDSSIMQNIAFGIDKEKINFSFIEKSAKIANLHDFIINELPQGYETIIGEGGVKLSGGQRQRIGLARAFYKNPQVLVLDEATSSLDAITEKKIMNEINNLDKNITIIMIAHRLNTLKNFDNIYILNNGEIEAQGTYLQLINSNENFKKMSN